MLGLAGIARTSGTMGVVQKRPILTPGVANVASSAATARSQAATSWQPAAVAIPCTRAITGWGNSRNPASHACRAKTARDSLLGLSDHLRKVVPRTEDRAARSQNDDPGGRRVHRDRSQGCSSLVNSSNESAFRLSGRLSVKRTTPLVVFHEQDVGHRRSPITRQERAPRCLGKRARQPGPSSRPSGHRPTHGPKGTSSRPRGRVRPCIPARYGCALS